MSEITPNTPNPVREDAYKQQLATKLGIDPQYIPGSPIWHSEEEIAAIAEMFSNMSGGSSGGGVLVVHDVDGTLDKTWQEIYDAIENGSVPIVASIPTSSMARITILGELVGGMPPTMKYNVYNIGANAMTDDPLYVADTSSDYPAKYTA